MLLYDYPLAFNPAKVKLAMVEKGLNFTKKQVDIFNGQSLSPWYLKINRSATVPTLVDGDKTITDSRDILKYVNTLGGQALGGPKVSTDDGQATHIWLIFQECLKVATL